MKRKGTVVVLHLAFRYPFAGVVWQLLHHLVGFRELGLDVYYIEDHRAWVYDATAVTPTKYPSGNLRTVGAVLDRWGFAGRWAFLDGERDEYIGMERAKCLELLRSADAVINLCGATRPREEHARSRMIYLETDPGVFQTMVERGDPVFTKIAQGHQLFFTYGYNIGDTQCVIPTGGIGWRKTRPPVLLDAWRPGIGPASPRSFTTVGTWQNKGNDIDIAGDRFFWSKHVNFEKVLDVAQRAGQPIELATDLNSGPAYERAIAGGFSFRPVIPMSLDVDAYHEYVSSSRGEFTVSKDLYVRTRSGWFSDRTVCYLAAGRPVVTQFTGFENHIETGEGLLGFHTADDAVEALRAVNADYPKHARAARSVAAEYFDAHKLLDEIVVAAGI